MPIELLDYLETYLSESRKNRFLEILARRTRFLTVVIEDVYQLHNTSAIIRSCDAFGIQEIHVIADRFGSERYQQIDKNIAMGAQQWVDVIQHSTATDCLDTLKDKGYQIVATTPHENGSSLSNFEMEAKTALFFGTEKEGLSDEIMQQADAFLQIPMVGFSESLNVSVSAAIILQYLADKLRKSSMPWQLSDNDILTKRLDWTKKSIKNVEQIIERYLKT